MVASWRGAAPLIAALALAACPRPDLDPLPNETLPPPAVVEEPDSLDVERHRVDPATRAVEQTG
jgi:hypothetical protein